MSISRDRATPLLFGWFGLLVAGFAVAARWRRRHPATAWKPRPFPTDRISRPGRVAALLFYLAGTLALADPATMLRVVSGGHAAPAAYEAMAYDEDFSAVRGPIVLGLLILSLLLEVAVILRGRRLPSRCHPEPTMSLIMSGCGRTCACSTSACPCSTGSRPPGCSPDRMSANRSRSS
jgi:hypothetical protein